jgi:hypothetical protein
MASKSITVELFEPAGSTLGSFSDAEIMVKGTEGNYLRFRTKTQAADGKTIVRERSTTLPYLITEEIEHDGLISV